MTSHSGRLFALAAALVAFFLAWAVVAAHPWATVKATRDPRLTALTVREHRLRAESRLVQRVVARRFSDYRRRFAAYKAAVARRQTQLASVQASAAAAPSPAVRIVTLPPLVITRTS